MPRPQFSLTSLLWLMAAVAAFAGGMALQKERDEPLERGRSGSAKAPVEYMIMRDGKTWLHSDLFEPIAD
jgi:hypothetical protein